MMKTLILLLLVFFSLVSCSSVEVQDVINANNLFSSDVYKGVLKDNVGKNFIASPFSVEAVMALAQSGANGETGEEIRNALRLPNSSKKIEDGFKSLLPAIKGNEFYSLHSANKIYFRSSVAETYEKIAKDVYQSEIEEISFYPDRRKAAETINKWVEDKTNNKIKNLIQPLSLQEETVLLLINAIYFKGKWTQKFELDPAKEFTKLNGEVVKTDFVKKTSHYNYHESAELNARFLEIPFSGDDASFVVILPNERDGLSALEQQTEKLFVKPEFTNAHVDVHLPKFKTETVIDFTKILGKLGIKKAFNLEEADFGGIRKPGFLAISNILQKAFFELTETGVEAAAATYVKFSTLPRSSRRKPKPIPFYADHPFIFYIKVKDIILFVGRTIDFPQ